MDDVISFLRLDCKNSTFGRQVFKGNETNLSIEVLDLPFPELRKSGFSLVEVTFALAIVTFSLLTIVGLLPFGLSSISLAAIRTGEANIAKQMSSQLQEIPLSDINNLTSTTYYYDRDGQQVSQGAPSAFFSATFQVNNPSIPGIPSSYSQVAQTVKVTLNYPQGIPAVSQKTFVFSLFVAQQSGN